MSDFENLVLMLTPENTEDELLRVERALLNIPKKDKISAPVFDFSLPSVKMSVREALLSPREIINIENALGRISASSNFFCPPAISVVVAGEEITSEIISLMKHCGYTKISVVK
jgi:arginine/lysine/ornithine decarboxylase